MGKAQQERKGGGLEQRLPLFACGFVGLLCLLVLQQGGFYAEDCIPYLFAFFLLAVLCYVSRAYAHRSLSLPVSGLLFALVGAFGVISGCLHGGALVEQLILCCPWFMAAVAECASANLSEGERTAATSLLGWAGAVSAVLGILMIAGLVPWPGSVSASRLNFTFQYANAAAVWFAVCALLGLFSSSKSLRIASILTVIALLLTRSVGVIVLFVLAVVVLGVRALKELDSSKRRYIIAGAAVGALVLVAVFIWFLVSGRIAQAGRTFAERLFQMHDALVLFAQNPLWGLGPDGWREAYEAVRSADYVSTVVHCSYLQVALDAGAFGLIALVGAIVTGFIAALKQGDTLGAMVIALMALHSLIDFDLRFGALLVLLAFFLNTPAISLRKG